MSTDKIREEFMAWLADKQAKREAGGWLPYDYNEQAAMLVGWKASRAALVVELPRSGYWGGYDQPSFMEADEVREAMRDAGITVKE